MCRRISFFMVLSPHPLGIWLQMEKYEEAPFSDYLAVETHLAKPSAASLVFLTPTTTLMPFTWREYSHPHRFPHHSRHDSHIHGMSRQDLRPRCCDRLCPARNRSASDVRWGLVASPLRDGVACHQHTRPPAAQGPGIRLAPQRPSREPAPEAAAFQGTRWQMPCSGERHGGKSGPRGLPSLIAGPCVDFAQMIL